MSTIRLKILRKYFLRLLLILLLLFANQVFADSPDLNQIKLLVDTGKSSEAYAIMAPEEENFSGNIDVDYIFAIAALDSGNVEKSISIFDRILSINPKFAGARIDLARAYFLILFNKKIRQILLGRKLIII